MQCEKPCLTPLGERCEYFSTQFLQKVMETDHILRNYLPPRSQSGRFILSRRAQCELSFTSRFGAKFKWIEIERGACLLTHYSCGNFCTDLAFCSQTWPSRLRSSSNWQQFVARALPIIGFWLSGLSLSFWFLHSTTEQKLSPAACLSPFSMPSRARQARKMALCFL